MAMSMRAARINANLKQEEAAKLLNITKNTLSNYERGISKPRVDTMAKMAAVYNCKVSDINFFAV